MENRKQKSRKESGYTLLEYAAGAAILMGILYVGLNSFGTGVKALLSGVGSWAESQATRLGSETAAPSDTSN